MRPEIGFAALGASRRLIAGTVITVVGAVLFLIGLFLNPGGTIGLILLAGGGALADLPRRRQPLDHRRPTGQPVAIGTPIQKVFGTPGKTRTRQRHRGRHGAPPAPPRR